MRLDTARRRILIPAVVVLALAVPVSTAEAASFVAGLRAPGHHPTAGKAWTIKVTARTRSGRPLRATAYYQFLYGGQVVSTQYPSPHAPPRHSPYPFKGSFKDPIVWPARAVGYRLVFRVVIHAKGRGTKKLSYSVRVRR